MTSTKATASAAPCGSPSLHEQRGDLRRHPRGAEAGGQEAGHRDADLDGGEEPVGVGDEVGEPLPALAALGREPLDLAVAQRDQGDLGGREEAADEREQQHDAEVEQELAHRSAPVPGWSSMTGS